MEIVLFIGVTRGRARRDWGKITRRRASIEKARRVLDYEPKIGIKKAFDWIVGNRDRIENSANK